MTRACIMLVCALASLPSGASTADARDHVIRMPDAAPGLAERFLITKGLQYEIEGSRLSPRQEDHGRITVTFENHGIALRGVEILGGDRDYPRMKIEEAYLGSRDDAGGALVLSDLAVDLDLGPESFAFQDWEGRGVHPICRLLSLVRRLDFASGELRFGDAGGLLLHRLTLTDGSLVPDPDDDLVRMDPRDCLNLSVHSRETDIRLESGMRQVFDDLRVDVDLPLTRAAARGRDSASHVDISARRLTLRYPDGTPFLIFNDPIADMRMRSRDLEPAFLSFDTGAFLAPRWNEVSVLMDAWNIVGLMRADLDVRAETLQVIASNIVPADLTTNFRRAQLMTIDGGLEGQLRMRRDTSGGMFRLHLSRLFDIGLQFGYAPRLFPQDALTMADRGEVLVSQLRPDMRLVDTWINWMDTGFHASFTDLFGLPPTSWFRRFTDQDDIDFEDEVDTWLDLYAPSLSEFFALSHSGDGEVDIDMIQSDPVGLNDLVDALASGPDRVMQIIDLDLRSH